MCPVNRDYRVLSLKTRVDRFMLLINAPLLLSVNLRTCTGGTQQVKALISIY
jgi:hypothetical protein